MDIENNNNTRVTLLTAPRQELLLPFKPLESLSISQPSRIQSQSAPQMQLSFDQIQRWKNIARATWASSTKVRGTAVYAKPITVAFMQSLVTDPLLRNTHEHFNASLEFSIELRSTVQHAGALGVAFLPPIYYTADNSLITYDPNFVFSPEYGQPWTNAFNLYSNFFPKIINPQENAVHNFSIPLSKIFDRFPMRSFPATPASGDPGLIDIKMGTFVIFVYSPLVTATTIDSLPIIIRAKLTDVEFDIPTFKNRFG